MSCADCGLVQLGETVERDLLFREYWYRSGGNDTMQRHLAAVVDDILKCGLVDYSAKDIWVDIGANDGTLLRSVPRGSRVGFEPSKQATSNHVGHWVEGYFTKDAYPFTDKAKVITSIAMMYSVEDVRRFAFDVLNVLAPDGLWVCEVNYLGAMLKNLAFDHICHEHVTYWSVRSFMHLVNRLGMSVHRVEFNDMNGGSARFYVKLDYPQRPVFPIKVEQALIDAALHAFPSRMERLREDAQAFFVKKPQVWAYGASTRGLTTLAWFGLDSRQIAYAVERNEAKVGRLYGATGIPVVSEAQFRKERPSYALVLPYTFMDEFVRREAAYLASGGRFVVPMPGFRVL